MSLWQHVLPQPRTVIVETGSFILSDLSYFLDAAPEQPRDGSYGALLSKSLARKVAIGHGDGRGITIRGDEELSGEAYRLTITDEEITIRAGTYDGVARAAATLASYRLQAGSGFEAIRACEIEDSPRYPWRGAMVDTARHFFPTSVLEDYLDQLFIHKLNVLHIHLTDDQGWRFPVPSWPGLVESAAYRDDQTTEYGTYGGYYSADELRALDAYAGDLGITIVPEIDLPGHTSSVFSAYPELSCRGEQMRVPVRWGIFEDVLCIGNEEVFTLVDDAVAAIARIFSGPYIHLGGDETPISRWIDCPKCAKRMEEQGLKEPEALHGYAMNRAADMVLKEGKRPVVWDEAISEELNRESLIMCWRGKACVAEALRAGFEVVAVPQERACYFDHKHLDDPAEPGRLAFCTVRDASEYDPDPHKRADRIIGLQGNLWTEEILYGRQLEYMSFPRLSAVAANGWFGPEEWDIREPALQRHRQRLLDAGVHVYPGAFE